MMGVWIAGLAGLAAAQESIRPDLRLTPGKSLTTDLGLICRSGYSRTVRHTSQALKRYIYREYGITPFPGGYEVDHLIPLSLGGADVAENLWPQSRNALWNTDAKDRLAFRLRQMVCRREIDAASAQRAIAQDWIAAYARYLGS